jgi:hypothetical protein
MGRLQGWTRPIVGGLGMFADHTQVNCTGVPGKVWPCWGVPPKGAVCCAGNGSTAQADCLSTPASKAGIVYAFTGVCHQTANRILFPAGVIVNRARGYPLSAATYGAYGLNLTVVRTRIFTTIRKRAGWAAAIAAVAAFNRLAAFHGGMNWGAKRAACAAVGGDLPVCTPPAAGGAGGGIATPENDPPGSDAEPMSDREGDDAYIESVLALYANAESIDIEMMDDRDFMVALQTYLGIKPEDGRARALIEARDALHEAHADALGRFAMGEWPTEVVTKSLNEAAQTFQAKTIDILGPDDFKKLFALSPSSLIGVIDPDIMLETYGDGIAP